MLYGYYAARQRRGYVKTHGKIHIYKRKSRAYNTGFTLECYYFPSFGDAIVLVAENTGTGGEGLVPLELQRDSACPGLLFDGYYLHLGPGPGEGRSNINTDMCTTFFSAMDGGNEGSTSCFRSAASFCDMTSLQKVPHCLLIS